MYTCSSSSTSSKRKSDADVAVGDVEACRGELERAESKFSEAATRGDELAQLKLDAARRNLVIAELSAQLSDDKKWLSVLDSLRNLQASIAGVVANSAAVSSSSGLSADGNNKQAQKRPKSGTVDPVLINPVIEATLEAFFANGGVAAPTNITDDQFDNAMNVWWSRAREFKMPNGERTFAQLLLESLSEGRKLAETSEVAPVFASLMFELMTLLSAHDPALFLFSEADLLKKVRWPAIDFVPPSRRSGRAHVSHSANDDVDVPSESTVDDECESAHHDPKADLAAVNVPSWLVHQRDGAEPNTHRKVDLAVFSHPGVRDATSRFNVCAQRNVCTAIEMKRDVEEASMKKAVSQLTQDYATTVGTQFVGHRRTMFGIIGTAARVRFCQLWSEGAHCQARVSPAVSIASASEVTELIDNPTKNWCDVVSNKSAFLQQIARVVVYSASGPTIDCGLKVPQDLYVAALGDYERIRFVDVLGVTRRSIVLSADLLKRDGAPLRVAFKRYCNPSVGSRIREVEALNTFGGQIGVVSLVGARGNEDDDVVAIATTPVGVALSQMCLCKRTVRDGVVEALKNGPVRALAKIHERGNLFADIHRGNIIVVESHHGSATDARFVDLESVRAANTAPRGSPVLDFTHQTAEEDAALALLLHLIQSIEGTI